MDNPTITISYMDLLDILDDYAEKGTKHDPWNVDAFAKYIWKQYRKKECVPVFNPDDVSYWDNPLVL